MYSLDVFVASLRQGAAPAGYVVEIGTQERFAEIRMSLFAHPDNQISSIIEQVDPVTL